MYPFRNILFPTDFTSHARAALKYAAAFARQGGGRVVLFSVQSASVPANLLTLPERIFEEEQNRWLLQVRSQVRNLLADPMFDGIEVEPVIVEGEPAPAIAKAVRQYNIDLVTVVTHGRKGLCVLFGVLLLKRLLLRRPARCSPFARRNTISSSTKAIAARCA